MNTTKRLDRLERLEVIADKNSSNGDSLRKYVPDLDTLSDEEFDVLCTNLVIARGEPATPEATALWEAVLENGFLSLSHQDQVTLVDGYQ